MTKKPVATATIERLSIYLKSLETLFHQNRERVSSDELASLNGLTPAQVRKDLSYFGCFGERGIGYSVDILIKEIRSILGLNREWDIAIIGLGNLGRALSRYKGFVNRGFRLVAIFDNDPLKIGVDFNGIQIYDIQKLSEISDKINIEIAIITVPEKNANEVFQIISKSNIKGVLNFSPIPILSTENIFVKNVSITQELELLTFLLK